MLLVIKMTSLKRRGATSGSCGGCVSKYKNLEMLGCCNACPTQQAMLCPECCNCNPVGPIPGPIPGPRPGPSPRPVPPRPRPGPSPRPTPRPTPRPRPSPRPTPSPRPRPRPSPRPTPSPSPRPSPSPAPGPRPRPGPGGGSCLPGRGLTMDPVQSPCYQRTGKQDPTTFCAQDPWDGSPRSERLCNRDFAFLRDGTKVQCCQWRN